MEFRSLFGSLGMARRTCGWRLIATYWPIRHLILFFRFFTAIVSFLHLDSYSIEGDIGRKGGTAKIRPIQT